MNIKERPHKKERDDQQDAGLKLSTLMDSMPDFLCFKDGEGRWVEANVFALKVFLLENVDYKGKKNTELVSPDHLFYGALKECDISDEAAWQKGTWRGDEIIPRPDGGAFIFDVLKVPRFNSDGSRKALTIVGRDITERKLAEDQAQVLLSAIESSLEAVAMADPEGKVTYVNPACVSLWGYDDKKEMIGRPVPDFWGNPENAQRIHEAVIQGKTESNERVGKKKDGTLFDVHISVGLVRDTAGNPKCTVLSAVDITKRKQAQIALLEAEWKFRALFDKGPIGVAYHEMVYDASGKPVDYRFLDANQRYQELTGVDPRGKTVTQAFPGIENDPFDWIGTYGHVARTGETIRFEQHLQLNDRWYDCVAYQYKPDHFVAAFSDITKRKQADEALGQSQKRLEETMEQARIADWEWDAASNTFTFNDRFYALYRTTAEREGGYRMPSEVYAREFLLPEEQNLVSKSIAKLLAGKSDSLQLDHRIQRRDGELRHIVVRVNVVRNKNGCVMGLRGSNQDITDLKRVEEALRESEERHRSILQTAMDGYCLVDMHGRLLEVNEAYCRMSGYDATELLTKRISELEANETPDATAAHIQKIIASGEDRFESLQRRKDGSVFNVEVSVQCRPDDHKMVAFLHDITERKKAETYRELSGRVLEILNEPAESEDFIPRVLDVLKKGTGFDAVGIRLQDGDDFPYLVQDGFPKDFLVKENSLLARTKDGGVCRGKDGNVCLECTCGLVISGVVPTAHSLFTKGGSFWSNDCSPLLHLLPSEEPRSNPRNNCIHHGYSSVALVPIRSHDKIVGLIQFNDRRKGCFTLGMVELLEGVAAHIGEALLRKQAEQTIAKSEKKTHHLNELLRAMYDIQHLIRNETDEGKLLDGVCNVLVETRGYLAAWIGVPQPDSKQVVAVAHAGRTTRILKEAPITWDDTPNGRGPCGTAVREWVPCVISDIATDPRFEPWRKAALAAGCGSVASFPILTEKRLWGVITIKAKQPNAFSEDEVELLSDLASEVGQALQSIEHRKERKRLEEVRRQEQKMAAIGQLAGGVAHDFNNILGANMLQIGLLMERPDLAPEMRRALEELEQGAFRASNLTRQLLMFSRKQAVQMKTLDMKTIMESVHGMLSRLLGESIFINLQTAVEPLWVKADQGMIEQVIVNLCVNARDAMPNGGKLTLRAEELEIQAGSAPVHLDVRPGRFICLSVADTGTGISPEDIKHIFEPFYTTKEVGKGTGLGLATVHGIIQQHGGWIEVESNVGEGSVFRVYLPFIAEEQATAAEGNLSQIPRGRETILLVEDDAVLLRSVISGLQLLGYRVVEAVDGADAFLKWQEHSEEIDLMLTDMVMPGGMSGLELAQQIQSKKPGFNVIISSGYSDVLTDFNPESYPGITLLPKPYGIPALARTIKQCLDASALPNPVSKQS